MAKLGINLCVTFSLCLFLLVGFGWSDPSQNSGSNQTSIEAPELQISLILRRLETVEKGKEELEKSNEELKKQVNSVSEKLDGLENQISEDHGLWLLTPPVRGPPGKDGKQGPKGDQGPIVPWSITSCSDVTKTEVTISQSPPSKKQTIYPDGTNKRVQVLCNFETDGGGWTIIQKRTSGPKEEFNRGWHEYKRGFGTLEKNFWLGLDNIHALTKNGDQELRIELEDFEGEKKWAKYTSFSVSDASDFYRLTISGFFANSTLKDMMTHTVHAANGARFSTKDKDHDTSSGENCAEKYSTGGWWINECYYAAPNGLYFGKGETVSGSGIYWGGWKGRLAKTEIKIRTRK